ncbi:MAG: oligosaccharide flippase family protein [Acidobacteria bacterium]|nr:oligosaccharide flippase family protein [Acidobacteriota bacterium]
MRDRLKHLTTGVAIYGAGDAAIQVVNFALLAVYVKGGFLTSVDYGALAILVALEAFAKVTSRLGLDGAFMRYFHERGDDVPRLASTIAWFLVATNVVLFGGAWLAAPAFGRVLFDDPQYVPALRLMLVNTALMSLTFIPFHVMRLQNRAATYSAFAFARSVGTLVLRIVFVIGLGHGVTGMYAADLVVTLVIVPLMWRWFRPYLRATFSGAELRTALRFGLPRVPHGIAQQALEGGNKLLLGAYIPQAQLGVYQNAVTLGTGVKFFTSAFETAWAPFYYATSRQPDAKETFSRMTTYAVAVLVLLVAGTTAVAREVILVLLTPDYLPAVPVLPIVAVAMGLQGLDLLTSIGLNLTSRTEFYPVATMTAAVAGLGSGTVLMPAMGVTGAAIALLLAYLTQTGVAYLFARRLYPIRYEWLRLARVVGAGVLAAVVARALPDMPPAFGLLVRGATAVGIFAGLLGLSGFLRATERAFIREKWRRLKPLRG